LRRRRRNRNEIKIAAQSRKIKEVEAFAIGALLANHNVGELDISYV